MRSRVYLSGEELEPRLHLSASHLVTPVAPLTRDTPPIAAYVAPATVGWNVQTIEQGQRNATEKIIHPIAPEHVDTVMRELGEAQPEIQAHVEGNQLKIEFDNMPAATAILENEHQAVEGHGTVTLHIPSEYGEYEVRFENAHHETIALMKIKVNEDGVELGDVEFKLEHPEHEEPEIEEHEVHEHTHVHMHDAHAPHIHEHIEHEEMEVEHEEQNNYEPREAEESEEHVKIEATLEEDKGENHIVAISFEEISDATAQITKDGKPVGEKVELKGDGKVEIVIPNKSGTYVITFEDGEHKIATLEIMVDEKGKVHMGQIQYAEKEEQKVKDEKMPVYEEVQETSGVQPEQLIEIEENTAPSLKISLPVIAAATAAGAATVMRKKQKPAQVLGED